MNKFEWQYTSSEFNEANIEKIYLGMSVYGYVKRYYVNSKGYTIKEEIISFNQDESKTVIIEQYSEAIYNEVLSLKGMAFNQVKVFDKGVK